MRPPRIIILVAFVLSILFTFTTSLRSARAARAVTAPTESQSPSRLQAFFSLRAPFSLFPPNAIITLTHDNTTAFLARPAAFGPLLPATGLKGQVWIGSGFGDESLRQGGAISTSEGELGCSDVPGYLIGTPMVSKSDGADAKSGVKPSKFSLPSEKEALPKDDSLGASAMIGKANDGTDDHLIKPVSKSDELPNANTHHADIQSIQEGAEIAGKVVLLSRGGCGFLEKVKWAQRRGAVALIVGDDQKGGPLIQMYARGDTSNVTIPAIFTSHTTAHLLSSLMAPGAIISKQADGLGKTASGGATTNTLKPESGTKGVADKKAKPVKSHRRGTLMQAKKQDSGTTSSIKKPTNTYKPGWFSRLFASKATGASRRPPSSGSLPASNAQNAAKSHRTSGKIAADKHKSKTDDTSKATSDDDFVIGVQDWRDPDLVDIKAKASDKTDSKSHTKGTNDATKQSSKEKTHGSKDGEHTLSGGSIVPGSGEYTKPSSNTKTTSESTQKKNGVSGTQSGGLISKLFSLGRTDPAEGADARHTVDTVSGKGATTKNVIPPDDELEGLWVTLTPTNGASPFLDTLLVLVVSPLVTLTVVYALLLVRSRLRRRRWRAPKSVVQRLPVRTYQTIRNSGILSPVLTSPTQALPTTPLLQRGSLARPRSRTTTGVPEAEDHLQPLSPLQMPHSPSTGREHESGIGGPSEWRKYMGRQVECVICLEEYVDGVSRVMSLPCGHEFHVDCMYVYLSFSSSLECDANQHLALPG